MGIIPIYYYRIAGFDNTPKPISHQINSNPIFLDTTVLSIVFSEIIVFSIFIAGTRHCKRKTQN